MEIRFILNHNGPELLVKAVTASSRVQARRHAVESVFEIIDVKAVRSTSAIVIADDEGKRRDHWGPPVMHLFQAWQVPIIPFQAGRNQLIELAATYRAR